MLPMRLIKVLVKLMSNFLWNGSNKSSDIKVKWDQIYKPLREGGLGLIKFGTKLYC